MIGFKTPGINNIILVLAIFFLSFVSQIFSKEIIKLIATASYSVLIGILALNIRIQTVKAPVAPYAEKFSFVKGNIDNITPLEKGYRIYLSNVKISSLSKKDTPVKIRITARTKLNNAQIDDVVKFNAILSQPLEPYLEGSYNFAQDAYFKQIGAVGYSVSEFKIIGNNKHSFISKVNSLRNRIKERVDTNIGSYYGSIATALMLNEYNNINKEILKNLRATGLAHILSVSGMHLSLVVAIFFFASRLLLNCFETIALRYNCKKIAALIALLGSLGYLLISGMEVAAVRSFIMSSMIIISILIDRNSNPMRAISIAAIIILLSSPENIIHPSFQMSFLAVLALIACFESFSKIEFHFSEFSFLQKILFYFLSLSLASLVAGLATTPFALYHFSNSSNYSILANLLAVPITSFILMPCVVLTFLLYPFHLENISLYIMKFGIEILIKITNYIASLPHAVSIFPRITDTNLLLIILGILWLCIWQTRLRIIGIFITIIGIVSQSFIIKPDIFVDWQNKTYAIFDKENNHLRFFANPLTKFKKQLVMNHFGVKNESKNINNLLCNDKLCEYKNENYLVEFDISNNKIKIFKDKKLYQIYENNIGTELITLK
ncbi:MAG: ComEC/Rec2 family competence protein [Pseudomonadota bacterium]